MRMASIPKSILVVGTTATPVHVHVHVHVFCLDPRQRLAALAKKERHKFREDSFLDIIRGQT